jgi:hypothetical protein
MVTMLPESYFMRLMTRTTEPITDITIEEKVERIKPFHDTPTAGHLGVKRTLNLMFRRGVSWLGVRKDIKKYVEGCLVCQKTKSKIGPGSNKLFPMKIPGSPWEVMFWDLIGPLPESRTYNAVVTMVDTKTKAIKLKAANITISAQGMAVIMKNRVFREEGLPFKVISNRGPQFVSSFVKELYDMLGVEGNPSTTYHPQTDGQTKRVN